MRACEWNLFHAARRIHLLVDLDQKEPILNVVNARSPKHKYYGASIKGYTVHILKSISRVQLLLELELGSLSLRLHLLLENVLNFYLVFPLFNISIQ